MSTVLGSTIDAGAHFTDSQAKSQNFQKVAKDWTDQCVSYDVGLEQLAQSQSMIQDMRTPLAQWEPDVSLAGELILRHKPSLQTFKPTDKAIKDMAVIGGTSEWFIKDMIQPKMKGEEVLYKRDEFDADILVRLLRHTLFNKDRVDQDKIRLIRTWSDGSMRAVLSERYAIVNNVWVLELMRKLLPGGLLSHWRGDADTILGNVLIPDSVRLYDVEKFGAMISLGNSEIGLRCIYTQPSAFRAICMNGCIWGQEKGDGIKQRHLGEINLDELAGKITENLTRAIPLCDDIVKAVLGCRVFKFENKDTVPVVAAFFNEFGLPKSLAVPYFKALSEERDCGTEGGNAFFLLQGVTRLSQTLSGGDWVDMDTLAGQISKMTDSKWKRIVNNGLSLTIKEVEKSLGDIAHLA